MDMAFGHGLHPHRLPDAAGRRVPDAAGAGGLLAARLIAAVGAVVDADDQLLRTVRLERIGDVEGEAVVAARVVADQRTVDVNDRLRPAAKNSAFFFSFFSSSDPL